MKRTYLIICGILALIVTISLLLLNINSLLLDNSYVNETNYSYPVIKEVTENDLGVTVSNFIKPFNADNVSIEISYYNDNDERSVQENSLIYYENTYMPSSGIFYTSDTDFDVLAVYDGTVTNIKEDSILGNMVEITHNNNLTTIYYSLKDITVKVNDEITTGSIIGKSNSNNITGKSTLLFEVYNQGKSVNPEEFYVKTIKDYE